MKLSEFPVKRAVTVTMMMLIIVVLGLTSGAALKVDLMPEMEFPNVVIIIEYSGAAPQEVERLVVKPVEGVVRTVSGIKNVKASAQEGTALIIAEFAWGTDLDTAIGGVREKIGRIEQYLPEEIEQPLIMKMNLAEMPVAFLYLKGDRSLADLQELGKEIVAPEIDKIDGVAQSVVMGGRKREIQVLVDQDRLLAYNLPIQQLIQRIRFENINISGGVVTENHTRYTLRTIGEFSNLEQLNNLVVGLSPTGAKVRLRDVAEVRDTFADAVGLVRVNRSSSIGLMVRKETDANLVEVCTKMLAEIPRIRKLLPEGIEFDVSFDGSEMIRDSTSALGRSSLEGAFLVVLVLFALLGSIRPTLIVTLSLPISLLAAFVFMYFGDLTINIMTLGGLMIAIGKIVDDSIVVMENIDRNRALGYDPAEAAIRGTREVFIAVLGATAATVVVFLPMAFSTGMAGQLFKPFGLTVFYALMASLLVSYTLVPMMASRILKNTSIQHEGGWFNKVELAYGRFLDYVLSRKRQLAILCLALLVLTGFLTARIGKEFLPELMAGIYRAQIALPVGSDLDATDRVFTTLEDLLYEFPDVSMGFAMLGSSEFAGETAAMEGEVRGPHSGIMMIKMKKGDERQTPEPELLGLADQLKAMAPTADVKLQLATNVLFGAKKPIEIVLEGNDITVLRKLADQIVNEIKDIPAIKNPGHTFQSGNPELQITVDRERLSSHGLLVGPVADDIRSKVEGVVSSRYQEAGDEHDIRVILNEEQRDSISAIGDLDSWSPAGYSVGIRDFTKTNITRGPGVIFRDNGRRVVRVTADISGRPLSDVIGDVKGKLDAFSLPEGYRLDFGGQFADMQESFLQLALVAIMALLLVYMILASLYESLIHPFTIMIPIPFALTGGVMLLYATGTPLGVTAFIGFIMLIGIVASNSIVLVDFAIREQAAGKPLREAVMSACTKRLRPVLATSATAALGMVPVALGATAGMEMHVPLGRVVVGGLISSTILTLVIVPAIYETFDHLRNRMRRQTTAVAAS